MANIAVDIDDTLYSFTDEAREQLSLMLDEPEFEPYRDQLSHALYTQWNQWRTPFELCGYDEDGESLWLVCIDRCHSDDSILRQRPFNNAVEVCNELAEAGHRLTYISNRSNHTEYATCSWLAQEGFPMDLGRDSKDRFAHTLVVTSGDKRSFIKDCQYMIDDRVKNVIDFVYDVSWTMSHATMTREGWRIPATGRRQAFMRVVDSNVSMTDVKGVWLSHTWSGLRRYMVRAGLLEGRVAAHA